MTTLIDTLAPDPRTRRIVNGKKRQLTENEVLSAVALCRMGNRHVDVATAFGVSESAIAMTMSGHRWSALTGIKPRNEKVTSRHAVALVDEIAKRPDDAPRLREMFDSKFGEGAALRSVKQLLTAGAR